MGRLDGKVVFITGAARGQGRSHAIRLAQEGADIIAVDICTSIDTVPYELATEEDLAQTAREVQSLGRRIVAKQVDVRDEEALSSAFNEGQAALGPVEIVLANAAICPLSLVEKHEVWRDVIDVNLTGVFNTVEAAIPSMIARGAGGSIVITSSIAGLNGVGGSNRGALAYTASKHGLVGLMRSYANNLAQHLIRVNTVHPTGVSTPMITNDAIKEFHANGEATGAGGFASNAIPIPMMEPIDISNAIMWLVSDDARYVTGVALPVDAGFTNKK
jgi:SDR family mycofactocin-dependent oxidoreductase